MDEDDILPNHLFISLKHEVQITRVVGFRLSPAKIKIRADLSVKEDDTDAYGNQMEIALEKISYWIKNVLENSIVIDSDNEWALDSFIDSGMPQTPNSVILAPEVPTDALLCELLLCKFKALSNDAFVFHSIEIESTDGRGLSFMFVGGNPGEGFPEDVEWMTERNFFSRPWWHRDDASTLDVVPDEDCDLNSPPSWAYSLGFIADQLAEPTEKPNNVVVRPEFRPKIIDGGKTD